jgi:HNH endonuclease
MCPSGGNPKTLQKYARVWGIPTDHFDPAIARRRANARRTRSLEEILVQRSTYNRGNLKQRLYRAGLKQPVCELCGQDEVWHGRRMSMILDHINGDRSDNRLENLQIVCANCAATLETHCGKNVTRKSQTRACAHCGRTFRPKHAVQRYCSHPCSIHSPRHVSARPRKRVVERPPYEQLMREIAETNYSAVGRKYGVSDNAIRKWVRAYERERAAVDVDEPAGGAPRLRLVS